jgi:hypothetical protein
MCVCEQIRLKTGQERNYGANYKDRTKKGKVEEMNCKE